MAYNSNNKGGKKPFKREPKEFEEQVIQIARVTKVVKGGRRLRFRATVAVGNRKGKIGVGIGKSKEVTGAIHKAIAKAKKEMVTVVLDGGTIPHVVDMKLKSSNIRILPAAPGTGLIAGSTIRKVLELAGIKDILSKSYGTTNKVNNTKAIIEALRSLKSTPYMEKRKQAAKQPVADKAKESVNKTAETPKAKEAVKKEVVKKEEPKKEVVKKTTKVK